MSTETKIENNINNNEIENNSSDEEYTDESTYDLSDDYTSDYSSSEYSTEDDDEEDSQLDILQSWTETMKKLKFMVELYNQECDKNKRFQQIFHESKTTIEEMKVEIQRLTQTQAAALNDLAAAVTVTGFLAIVIK